MCFPGAFSRAMREVSDLDSHLSSSCCETKLALLFVFSQRGTTCCEKFATCAGEVYSLLSRLGPVCSRLPTYHCQRVPDRSPQPAGYCHGAIKSAGKLSNQAVCASGQTLNIGFRKKYLESRRCVLCDVVDSLLTSLGCVLRHSHPVQGGYMVQSRCQYHPRRFSP